MSAAPLEVRNRLTRPPRWCEWTKERMTLEAMRKLLELQDREEKRKNAK